VSPLQHVDIAPLATDRFASVLDGDRFEELQRAIERSGPIFEGRTVWNVNSTARGGGVAEMLRSLLAYARGAGVDARWLVIGGSPEFFTVTKRIHNRLHGAEGDGGALGNEERTIYESVLSQSAEELAELMRPGDVVLLHDPQTAGLIEAIGERVAVVIWRCHVGLDLPNDRAREAWRFLIPYVARADGYVFSREAFAWEGLDGSRMTVIPPSIDAFSPKNQDMDEDAVASILATTGLLSARAEREPTFTRIDGSTGRVERATELYDGGSAPPPGARLVVQVSRWDRLKDPAGVIRGFAEAIAPQDDSHLVVAGPAVAAVSDDPEGAAVLEEMLTIWKSLDPGVRGRVHLACLPMDDGEENAAIVNALQRRADVIVQKSLAEGFGLTVAEGMWKGRPVVASRIGGIQDQIADGETGILIDDPTDLEEYGAAVRGLLDDPAAAEQMGRRARERVRDDFLGARHLIQYVDLFARYLERAN
jgi:trehalose synthase